MSEPTNPPRPAVQVPPAEIPSLKTLLTLAVFVVIIAGLYLAREVLIPVTLAVLLSFLLAPLANLLHRLHLGKVPAVFIAVILALGLVLGIGMLIGTQLADLAQDAPRYKATVQQKIDAIRDDVTRKLAELTGRINGVGQPTPERKSDEAQKPLAVEVRPLDPSPFQVVGSILAPAVSPLTTLGVVFTVSIFVLLQREDLRNRFIRLFGSRDLHGTTVAMDDAASRLSRYFVTQFSINCSFGLVIGLGLFFLGVPSPILWAILGTLLRFVPYVGAALSALGPLALAAAVAPGWVLFFWTAALYLVVETVLGQAVEPIIYGRSTGLSPISIVIAAIFWTWLWGPIGLVLSTPLTMCLSVLGRHVDRLEFLDVLLGDSPPLTPVESFYRRLLTGDPDEALDEAERSLKHISLLDYYDDVVLKSLQLAANDIRRGVMKPDQLHMVRHTMDMLLADLAAHSLQAPPGGRNAGGGPFANFGALPVVSQAELPLAWQVEGSVLCLAAREPLDAVAAAMLGQVLTRCGLRARTVPFEAVSRGNIDIFHVGGAAMICVCCLGVSGRQSHLRFLLRRLRQRMAHVPILVSFLASDSGLLADSELRAELDADHYATSLQGSVRACLEAAGVPRPPEEATVILSLATSIKTSGL
jgi:predicted PurR-regulated permease PerM